MAESLSAALEDYLEVIMQLSNEGDGAKISDIARCLNIAKPSVTQAISLLEQEGFVSHQRYGPVILTDKGWSKAREVWYKHETIRDYLIKVLGVSPVNADKDACLMEHLISRETMEKMENHLQEHHPLNKPAYVASQITTLSELEPGDQATVVKLVTTESRLRRRLLDMGVVAGTELIVERLAPLGDPVEIEMNGFHLSLRKDEAAAVIVKRK